MRYLIDGYNLLHALGLARKGGTKADWERSRRTLLDWLADQNRDAAAQVTVVLDAQQQHGDAIIEASHRELRVVRWPGRSADDLIEEFIAREQHPADLTVVSNDARVHDAAIRGHCRGLSCSEYVDLLLDHSRSRVPAAPTDEKAQQDSLAERAELLKAFGG